MSRWIPAKACPRAGLWPDPGAGMIGDFISRHPWNNRVCDLSRFFSPPSLLGCSRVWRHLTFSAHALHLLQSQRTIHASLEALYGHQKGGENLSTPSGLALYYGPPPLVCERGLRRIRLPRQSHSTSNRISEYAICSFGVYEEMGISCSRFSQVFASRHVLCYLAIVLLLSLKTGLLESICQKNLEAISYDPLLYRR